MTTNAQRATCAEEAVFAYASHTQQTSGLGNPEDYTDVMSDLFTDLLHLCDREGLNIDLIADRAYRHHEEEVFEESDDPESIGLSITPSVGEKNVSTTGAAAPSSAPARRRGRHLSMG